MKASLLYSLLQVATTTAAALLPRNIHSLTEAVLSTNTSDVSSAPSGHARLKTIYQYPNDTWIENLAVRKDGKLLVTFITTSEVHLVDPISRAQQLVYSFPNASSATGIVELEDGFFVVAIGNWSTTTFAATPGSWSVWGIDYRTQGQADRRFAKDMENLASIPKIYKITDIPDAIFLNGVTSLPTQKDQVLIADSGKGVIYRVNAQSGQYVTIIDSPALKPNATAISQLGVNGIHVQQTQGKPYLYFTNTFKTPMFGRFLLNANGSANGDYETIIERAPYPLNVGGSSDDFAFDRNGNAWITSDGSNTLAKVTLPKVRLTVVAGGANETVIAGDTSAAFGRTPQDQDILYIVTNGGIASPPPGGYVGGKVIALNTTGL